MQGLGFEAKLSVQSWSVTFLQSGTYLAPPNSILKKMKMSCRRMKTTNHLYYAFLNCNYGILFACFWYRHRLTRFVHMRTRYSNISCAWLVIESGDYFVQHIQKYSDNLRVVTNRAWRLIEHGVWSSVASDRAWRLIERIRYLSLCGRNLSGHW